MNTEFPPFPELDYQSALTALKSYAFPRKALADAIARGDLLRIKKGIYAQQGRGIPQFSREVLANMIYGPSYVSFEYALSYHGLIPERVDHITSATTGKSKEFTTSVGGFLYSHFSREYYSIGFYREELAGQRGFWIAEPEKAVMDKIMVTRGRFNELDMRNFLFDDL